MVVVLIATVEWLRAGRGGGVIYGGGGEMVRGCGNTFIDRSVKKINTFIDSVRIK